MGRSIRAFCPSTSSRAALAAAGSWLLVELARGGAPWVPAFPFACAGLWSLYKNHGRALLEKAPAESVFCAAAAVYLSTFRWHGGDDVTNSLVPLALLKHGTLALDPVIDPFLTGKTNDFTFTFGTSHLSFHPIAGGLLAVPFYIVPVLTGAVFTETFLHNLSKVSASVITALSAVFFFKAVSLKAARGWALALTAVYAFGSFAASVSSQALWQHGPAQLGVALGLWGLSRDDFEGDCLAGLGMGLAVVARTDSVLWAAAAAGYLLCRARRRLPGFLTGAAAPAAFLGAYWLYYTGRLAPPETQFQTGLMTAFQPSAFVALLASPTRGLLFFCPAALVGVWAASREPDPMSAWLLSGCAGTWLLFSHYNAWVGGMTFGPRYLAVAAMVLLYLCAGAEKEFRAVPRRLRFWAMAAAFSVLVNLLGGYLNWPGSFGVSYEKAQVWDLSLHPVVNLARSDGPLGAWPALIRVTAFFGWIIGWVALSRWSFGIVAKVRRA